MDTERDMDIATVEIELENLELVREFYREQLGKRMNNDRRGNGAAADNQAAALADNQISETPEAPEA